MFYFILIALDYFDNAQAAEAQKLQAERKEREKREKQMKQQRLQQELQQQEQRKREREKEMVLLNIRCPIRYSIHNIHYSILNTRY